MALFYGLFLINELPDIYNWCIQEARFEGTFEVDASYFEPRRLPGKRGCEASEKNH